MRHNCITNKRIYFSVQKLITSIKVCLDKIKIHWPEVQFEGVENLWLIKPSAQSCGRGIVIMKTLSEIRNHCLKRQPVIVQKYIGISIITFALYFYKIIYEFRIFIAMII